MKKSTIVTKKETWAQLAARYRAALQRITDCHGVDECGMCGSLRIAMEALSDEPKP